MSADWHPGAYHHHLTARWTHRAGRDERAGDEAGPRAGGHHHRVTSELALIGRRAGHPSTALEQPVDLRGDEPRARAVRGDGERRDQQPVVHHRVVREVRGADELRRPVSYTHLTL